MRSKGNRVGPSKGLMLAFVISRRGASAIAPGDTVLGPAPNETSELNQNKPLTGHAQQGNPRGAKNDSIMKNDSITVPTSSNIDYVPTSVLES